jgi:hypothetical protein
LIDDALNLIQKGIQTHILADAQSLAEGQCLGGDVLCIDLALDSNYDKPNNVGMVFSMKYFPHF